MPDTDSLQAHAERLRGSGVLGRSPLMRRLFDYLVDCSLQARVPKEIEVAIEVFGKDASFEVSQDAVVRVYVHKLRRKLEEFRAGPGRSDPKYLAIPKGTYRVVLERALEHAPEAGAAPVSQAPVAARVLRRWWPIALAASLLFNAVLGVALYRHWMRAPEPLRDVRSNPVWSRILSDDRTIFLVLGDYYIFGETDGTMEVRRLVRDFSVNSAAELEQFQRLHPELADRYLDLQLDYLPTAAAFALREVMPVLAAANRRIRVVLASDLSPAVLTSADVIYIGYLSGMGRLGDLVFAGSRFSVGDSYDELIDRATGHRYVSQATTPIRSEAKYHDYGYFATFAGPSGNQIVILSGTRDVAVMHTAETVARAPGLEQLLLSARGARSFEALYDVSGLDRMNLDGRLLLTSPLSPARIWTGEPHEDAPAPQPTPAPSDVVAGPIRAPP